MRYQKTKRLQTIISNVFLFSLIVLAIIDDAGALIPLLVGIYLIAVSACMLMPYWRMLLLYPLAALNGFEGVTLWKDLKDLLQNSDVMLLVMGVVLVVAVL